MSFTPDVNAFYRRLRKALERGETKAYRHYGQSYSYAELWDQVGRFIRTLSRQRRQRVLVYGGKSLTAYAAIYGILLSDNVWVPMTPEQALGRNRDIMELTEATLLLSDDSLPEELATLAAQRGIRVMSFAEILAGEPLAGELPAFKPDDEAYIMFTSGSTGRPKGVPMTHANYIPFVLNALDILPLGQGEVFSDYHDFAFDISIFYLFCAPLSGGCLAPVTSLADRVLPLRFIRENAVSVWSSVPSVMARIAQAHPDIPPLGELRVAFLCGEPFSLPVLRYCQEVLGIPHVYNFYGLTETGVENFHHACRIDDVERYAEYGFVPIGQPLPGNAMAVTEDKELLLSGPQLTPGYLGGVGNERFELRDSQRWYHTGDIVEEHQGVWFCKGRLDSQVKLSGYRIELMDIEVHLRRQPGVAEAVCFIEESRGRRRLAGVVKPVADCMLDTDALRHQLAAELPAYMVPARLVEVADIPLNANGKIDRRQVRELHGAS